MFTAHITQTARGYHPSQKWHTFYKEEIHAPTLPDLKAQLAERYGKSWKHKRPMYCDLKAGGTVRRGWVVGFRTYSYDSSQGPRHAILQQDWISLSECTPVNL